MKLMICGPGQSGKDTLAEFFALHSTLRYTGSTSWYAIAYVQSRLEHEDGIVYKTLDECYVDRVNHRELWSKYISEYNKENKIRLYQECLRHQDILTGIRKHDEFITCKEHGLFDLSIWVKRNNTKFDSTMGFIESDCDITIVNNGLRTDLESKVISLCHALGISKESKKCTLSHYQEADSMELGL